MKKLGMFVLGGAVGAVAALMVAPRPGDETRAIVTDWASSNLGDMGNLNERLEVRRAQIIHDAGIVADQAGVLAASGVEKAKAAVSSVQIPQPGKQPAQPEADAELRARIDQARARIAEQVAQNAARASEAVGGAIPTVQEAAKDVADRVQETAAAAAEAMKGAVAKEEPVEAEPAKEAE